MSAKGQRFIQSLFDHVVLQKNLAQKVAKTVDVKIGTDLEMKTVCFVVGVFQACFAADQILIGIKIKPGADKRLDEVPFHGAIAEADGKGYDFEFDRIFKFAGQSIVTITFIRRPNVDVVQGMDRYFQL